MLKWIVLVVLLLAATAGVAALVGSRLPRDHVATVRATYAAPPAALWALMGNPATYASWRTDAKAIELLPLVDGKAAWRETTSDGVIDYQMAESDPGRRMVTRITSTGLPYGGQWEFSLEPAGAGSVLTITERGFVNPAIFRFMARYLFGYTSSLEGYHRVLGEKLGSPVTPEVVAPPR